MLACATVEAVEDAELDPAVPGAPIVLDLFCDLEKNRFMLAGELQTMSERTGCSLRGGARLSVLPH